MSTVTARRTSPFAPDLAEAVRSALAAPSWRPPLLPAVALEVLQLTRSPDVQLSDVVSLLERDPVLAGRVLGIAGSAQYSRRSPVVSLRQAAVRLGLEALSQVVVQAALELRVFQAPDHKPFAKRLNRHAAAIAGLTRAICKCASAPSEHAFVAGLVHDVGFAACLQVVADVPRFRAVPIEELAPVLDALHTEASGRLVGAWKLPDAIRAVASTHHDAAPGGHPSQVNAAVVLAHQLAWEAGAGLLPPPPEASAGATKMLAQPEGGLDCDALQTVEQAIEVLWLEDEDVLALRAEAFELVEALPG